MPPPALGQWFAAARHEVQSTYRVGAQFGMGSPFWLSGGSPFSSRGGPSSSGTSSGDSNIIGPNSSHVEDSSCPAVTQKALSKPQSCSAQPPRSSCQAAKPAARMSLVQSSPCGQYSSIGALNDPPYPYSCSLPGSLYGPNTSTSTPILPWLSSIQYPCRVWPPLYSLGVA